MLSRWAWTAADDVGLSTKQLVVLDRPAVVHAALLVLRQVHALLHEGLGRRLVLEREGRLDRVEALRRRLLAGSLLEVLERVPDRPGAAAEGLELGHLLRGLKVRLRAHHINVVERDVALLEGLAERARRGDAAQVLARRRAIHVRLSAKSFEPSSFTVQP